MCTLANWELNAHRQTEANGKPSVAKHRRGPGSPRVLVLILVLACACLIPAHAASESQDSSGKAPARQSPRHHYGSSLDDRVRILSHALDLDAMQQSELRKVLEGQREQVKRIWSDISVPAAYRVIATQAMSDKTADQIRALLNEEQRKKYKPPRQHDAADGSAKPSVEDWMNVAKPK